MTNEERQLIQDFIQRVGGVPAASGFAGSVPATTTPALPPIDRDADAAIADLFTRFPEARYRVTQMAFVQEHALAEAQNAINRLQWELQNLKQQQAAPQPAPQAASPWGAAAQQPQAAPAPSRGIFGGLFGGSAQPAAPPQPAYQQPQQPPPQYAPPPPQYAPGYQPGMFQRQGSGFLGSALTTAAGVAGGVVAGEALMNLFSGHHAGYGGGFGGGGFGGGGFGGPAAVEYVQAPPSGNPWSAASPAAPAADPYDVGGAAKDPSGWSGQDQGWQSSDSGGASDPGSASDPGWQQQDAGDSGWQDSSAAPDTDSGWTDSSSDDIQNV